MSALSDDPLDIVSRDIFGHANLVVADFLSSFFFPKPLPRGTVYTIPKRADNIRTFWIAMLKRDQDFVTFLRHEHDSTTTSSTRRRHSRPSCRAFFHPIVLDLHTAHSPRVVVVDHRSEE